MRRVGDKLVARLVEVVYLLAHLVERGGELRHFALALHMDAVFIVALAHPLDAAGKLRDRPGHNAGDQPRQHQHRRQRQQEDERHAVAHGDQRIHRLLHVRQQQQRAGSLSVRLQRRHEAADPHARNIAPGQRVQHGRRLRLARAVPQVETVIRILFAAQNGAHLAERQQRAAALAERVIRHLSIRVHNQKAAAALAGRLQKPLMKRIRRVAPQLFAQRGGEVLRLRRVAANRVGKQRVADQPHRRKGDQIKRRADHQHQRREQLGANGMERVNPCR